MARQHGVFDIVGPVMIGPSSSHTAGAARLAALARAVFGAPSRARVTLHGSFGKTGKGHGTDLALVAGLLGFTADDPRIRNAFEYARQAGMEVELIPGDLGEVHPNTVLFELWDEAGRSARIMGSSLGGGDVVLGMIDGFEVQATGDLPMLVVEHYDRPGEIAAVTGVLADSGINIAEMRVAREKRGAKALMLIETDLEVDSETAHRIAEQPGVVSVRRVPAL